MNKQLSDENFSSTILKKQLERTKKKEEIRDVIHESIQTEFSVPCSFEVYDSENANTEFWRLMAGKFASELDKLREDNIRLENLINSKKIRLNELKDLNTELLEKAQYLENADLLQKFRVGRLENMLGRALCQVQNIPTHATRKAGELKRSKTVTTNAKDGDEKIGTKNENQNLERSSVNIEEKLNETKVLKAELLHESPNIIEDGNEKNGAETENQNLERTPGNTAERLNETKVLKTELLHKSPNTIEVAVQTNVIVNIESPKLTAEDLRSPEVSANYWRRLEEQLYIQSERKARINFELSIRLAKLNEEIAEKEEDYLALKHYISAEENIEHLSESELNENKNVEREDEEDNMFQKT